MLRKYATLMATVATLAPLGAGTLDAQIPPAQQTQQQQLQRMQEQVQRLDETMRRMEQIQQRAQEMERLTLRDMERTREEQALQQQEGAQAQVQAQSQERIRNQEQIRVMAHSLASAAGEMTQAMLSLREMAQESQGLADGEMVQQMERLREHMQDTCDQMEAGLQVMEQLRDRLSRP